MYEHYEFLRIERRGRILQVAMDNPPVNAMTPKMHNELSRIFFDINRDPDTAVVVFTGTGKTFCGGGNIDNMKKRNDAREYDTWVQTTWEAKNIVRGMVDLERPLIARINGHAMGLGATLAVFADFSYMLESARIADTHVKVGLTAGDGGAMMWPFLIGFARARRYLMTGDALTGKEAADIGLITESAASIDELDDKVNAMAERLAGGASVAINFTKASINFVLRKMLDGVMETHLGWETNSALSADHREAVNAFIEKREPKFTGR